MTQEWESHGADNQKKEKFGETEANSYECWEECFDGEERSKKYEPNEKRFCQESVENMEHTSSSVMEESVAYFFLNEFHDIFLEARPPNFRLGEEAGEEALLDLWE